MYGEYDKMRWLGDLNEDVNENWSKECLNEERRGGGGNADGYV